MQKYTIQARLSKGFHAGCKASDDVCKVMETEGYIPFYISFNKDRYNKVIRNILLLGEFYKLYKTLQKDDIVLVQWPLSFRNMRIFYWVIKHRCANVYLLIHDINILRGDEHYAGWAKKFLRLAKKIVAHSQPMKDWLIEQGYRADIKVLTAFDYLTDDKVTDKRKKSTEVVFAGNLMKSEFLQKISAADLGLTLNCYGKKVDNLAEKLTYKCAFSPENISVLEGSWGLVWDGDSLDTCNGPMGEYQHYNSPHKLSLYIVAHLPVIVWKEAAMAQYVKEKGIGICVSSLSEIAPRINSMTDDEYQTMMVNIKKEAQVLRSGGHVKACLE